MATGMTQSDYAKKIGCSRQYVSKQVKMGKLRVRNGLIYLDSVEIKGNPGAGEKISVPRSEKQGVLKAGGYWNKRTETETFNALLKELEYHKLIGTLVIAEDVQKIAFSVARKVRDLLNVLPERLAHVLAEESKPEKVKEVLLKEIRQAEDELADGFSRKSVPVSVRHGNPA